MHFNVSCDLVVIGIVVVAVHGQGNVAQMTPPKPLHQSGFKHTSGTVKMLFCAIRQKRYRLDWYLRRVLLHKSVHASTPLCVCFKMATGLKIKIFIRSRCFYFFCHESTFLSHLGLEQLRSIYQSSVDPCIFAKHDCIIIAYIES